MNRAYEVVLLALVAWRESRGESPEAQLGVMWSVLNRAAIGGWWGSNPVDVILHPYQYSSFDYGDPNSIKWPANNDTIFARLLEVAAAPGPDPTGGATNYYSGDAVPNWARQMIHTVDIGSLHFFKDSRAKV